MCCMELADSLMAEIVKGTRQCGRWCGWASMCLKMKWLNLALAELLLRSKSPFGCGRVATSFSNDQQPSLAGSTSGNVTVRERGVLRISSTRMMSACLCTCVWARQNSAEPVGAEATSNESDRCLKLVKVTQASMERWGGDVGEPSQADDPESELREAWTCGVWSSSTLFG